MTRALEALWEGDNRLFGLATATPYQPVDAKANCKAGKARAGDWTRGGVISGVLPVGSLAAFVDPIVGREHRTVKHIPCGSPG
jgi:hypothetical protein